MNSNEVMIWWFVEGGVKPGTCAGSRMAWCKADGRCYTLSRFCWAVISFILLWMLWVLLFFRKGGYEWGGNCRQLFVIFQILGFSTVYFRKDRYERRGRRHLFS